MCGEFFNRCRQFFSIPTQQFRLYWNFWKLKSYFKKKLYYKKWLNVYWLYYFEQNYTVSYKKHPHNLFFMTFGKCGPILIVLSLLHCKMRCKRRCYVICRLASTVLANMNEQFYSWTFKFCKVVRQQIWIEVALADFIAASSAVHIRMRKWENH